jgi:hypothetical protein
MSEADGRYLSLAVWRNRAGRGLAVNAPVALGTQELWSTLHMI